MQQKEGHYQRINKRYSIKKGKCIERLQTPSLRVITKGSTWQSNPILVKSCAHSPSMTQRANSKRFCLVSYETSYSVFI